MARVATCPCSQTLAKRSPRICGVVGRKVPVGVYFCVRKLPSAAFEAPVVLDQSFGIASSVPALMLPLTEHINFAMGWPPSCCVKVPRSVRSASCWVTIVPNPIDSNAELVYDCLFAPAGSGRLCACGPDLWANL